MAQTNTYRQQSSGSLGALTNCPNCSTYTNYAVQYCSGGGTIYVNNTNAFSSSQPVLLSTSYNIGDVVWVTPSQGGARVCATITGLNQNVISTQFFDIASGPWSQCSQCITP